MAQLGVRNGVKLEATGTRTERERKWLYSSAVLLALGQAVRVIYMCARREAIS